MKTTGLKTCVLFIKYVPIVSALVMLLYVSSLVFDKATPTNKVIVERVFTLPAVPTVGTMVLSKGLGFCNLHRYFIGYTYGVTSCMAKQAAGGFGEFLVPMRLLMLLIGIALFVWLAIHSRKHKFRVCPHNE